MKSLLILFVITLAVFTACNSKSNAPTPVALPAPAATTNSVNLVLQFKHICGTQSLTLNNKMYLNANADSFSISTLKYYFTNIKLQNTSNTVIKQEKSYYLIDHSKPEDMTIKLKVPEGDYTTLHFLIGVDESRNTSGAQTDALDPLKGMFWSWNTGYIMTKIEGQFRTPNQATKTSYIFHLGGFTGANTTVSSLTLNLPNTANVSANTTPTITITGDINNFFKSPTILTIDSYSTIMLPSATSAKLAINFAQMFTVTAVSN